MNALTIKTDNDRITVSARELHKALEITERFSSWMDRNFNYGFEDGIDYVGCKEFNTLARQELQDYQLTIEMAKQICMIQRSEKGKQYREYFLQLEKDWNSPEKVMMRALDYAHKQMALLGQQVEAMKPKALFADAVSASHSTILIGELAKILKANGYQTGQNRLFETLRQEGYLISRKGTDYNMPTQKSMELGLMQIKETTINHPDGHISVAKTVKITGKGQQYFVNRYCEKEES